MNPGLRRACLLLLVALGAGSARAEVSRFLWAPVLQGDIRDADVDTLRQRLEGVRNPLIFVGPIGGGSVGAATRLGQLFRERGVQLVFTGACWTPCAEFIALTQTRALRFNRRAQLVFVPAEAALQQTLAHYQARQAAADTQERREALGTMADTLQKELAAWQELRRELEARGLSDALLNFPQHLVQHDQIPVVQEQGESKLLGLHFHRATGCVAWSPGSTVLRGLGLKIEGDDKAPIASSATGDKPQLYAGPPVSQAALREACPPSEGAIEWLGIELQPGQSRP